MASIASEKIQSKGSSSKRRKTKDTSVSAETENTTKGTEVVKPDRRVRGRRGHLKFMTEIPLDTLHDIFRQLDPIDLVHLSWANKSLRNIVMEKSARYIWEQAFEKLYRSENPPPRCPKDLNLAQYARFLFSKKCTECDAAGRRWSSWVMRSRVCLDCLTSDRFVRVPYYEVSLVLDSLPVLQAKSQVFCPTRDYDTGFSRTKWHARTEARKKGSDLFNKWENRRHEEREGELEQLRSGRQAIILEKLAGTGWTASEVQRVTDGMVSKLGGFSKSKKLTEKEWDKLQPRILERLQGLKKVKFDKWQAKESLERWARFKRYIKQWAKSQKRPLSLRPFPIDLVLYEPFRSVIFTPTREEDLEFSLDNIGRVDKEWTESRNKTIISKLPEEYSAQITMGGDSELPLLAALMFHNHGDREIEKFRTISEVCEWRADCFERSYTPKYSVSREDRPLLASVNTLRSVRPWLWDHKRIQFYPEAHEVAKELLALLGFDPLTTTISRVRRCKREFKCVRCDKDDIQRPSMDWESAIKHKLEFHRDCQGADTGSDKQWEIIKSKSQKDHDD